MSRQSLNHQRSSEALNLAQDPNNMFGNLNVNTSGQQNFYDTSFLNPSPELQQNLQAQQVPSPSLNPQVFHQPQPQSALLGSQFDPNQGGNQAAFNDFSLYNDGQSPTNLDPNAMFGAGSTEVLSPQGLMPGRHSPHLISPPNNQLDWSGMSFHQIRHQRALSDQSDISPQPSPYIPNQEFGNHHSPLLRPEQAGEMTTLLQSNESFGLDQFNLNDGGVNGISPHHSPRVSPHITPQHTGNSVHRQSLQGSPFMMNQFQFPQQANGPANTATLAGLGLQPGLGNGSLQPDQVVITPPSIEVEFAPPQRQPTFPEKFHDDGALSPPSRGRNRQRSHSDPPLLTISRPETPEAHQPSSFGASGFELPRRDSLHPTDFLGSSLRASSPTPSVSSVGSSASHSSSKHVRRSSTSAIPNRDYILDLADPKRPGVSGSDTKRVQKHPATFQCTLCPKRFTRAYNLRSHLRTHTDERPFVCTVCGKAFARQHDRKRHEGLHSGEKRFVCRGELKSGGNWGCSRRFARADALGRHFRSEAGRVCIKPLLDEEADERMRRQAENNMAMYDPNVPYPTTLDQLPLALLTQYPALASAWETLANAPAGSYDDDEDDKRGSFDASSGGEWDDGASSGGLRSHRNSYDGSAFSREDWSGSDAGWHSDTGEPYPAPQQNQMWMKHENKPEWNLPG